MALKMNFREVTPEDTEILRMIALRNGKAEDLYVAMLLLLETVSFGLHQEKWMALSCMPTLYSMKTGRSSHGMNRKI